MAARTSAALTPSGSGTWRPMNSIVLPDGAGGAGGGAESPGGLAACAARSRSSRAAASIGWSWSSLIPSTIAAEPTSRSVRSAELGTASTFSRWPTCTCTSAFMPGFSSP